MIRLTVELATCIAQLKKIISVPRPFSAHAGYRELLFKLSICYWPSGLSVSHYVNLAFLVTNWLAIVNLA